MSTEKLKYVTRRRNKKGDRWYWQRKGFPLMRLPDDSVKRFAQAHKLNEQAERAASIETVDEDTIGWEIERYRESDRFQDKAPETQRIYERWLKEFNGMWGALPPSTLTRRVVVTFAEGIESRASRVQAVAALYNLLDRARYFGLVEVNAAAEMRLSKPKPRQQRWEWEDVDKFLAVCDRPSLRVAFYLLLYTAQRPGDVVNLKWSAYNGKTIRLRQQKTGKPIEVRCHHKLRAVLDEAKAQRRGVNIVARENGAAISRDWLGEMFSRTRKKAGLDHLQARDLRRTAIVLMGEADCEEYQIAAVSGHSIENTRQILETYLPRTSKMADAAIRKWEQSDDRV